MGGSKGASTPAPPEGVKGSPVASRTRSRKKDVVRTVVDREITLTPLHKNQRRSRLVEVQHEEEDEVDSSPAHSEVSTESEQSDAEAAMYHGIVSEPESSGKQSPARTLTVRLSDGQLSRSASGSRSPSSPATASPPRQLEGIASPYTPPIFLPSTGARPIVRLSSTRRDSTPAASSCSLRPSPAATSSYSRPSMRTSGSPEVNMYSIALAVIVFSFLLASASLFIQPASAPNLFSFHPPLPDEYKHLADTLLPHLSSQLEASLEQVRQSLNQHIKSRLATISRVPEETSTSLRNLQKELSDLSETVSSLQSSLTDTRAELDHSKIEAQMEDVLSRLFQLQKSIVDAASQESKQNEDTTQSIQDLQRDVARMKEFSTNLSLLEKQIKDQSDSFAEKSKLLGVLQTDLEKIRGGQEGRAEPSVSREEMKTILKEEPLSPKMKKEVESLLSQTVESRMQSLLPPSISETEVKGLVAVEVDRLMREIDNQLSEKSLESKLGPILSRSIEAEGISQQLKNVETTLSRGLEADRDRIKTVEGYLSELQKETDRLNRKTDNTQAVQGELALLQASIGALEKELLQLKAATEQMERKGRETSISSAEMVERERVRIMSWIQDALKVQEKQQATPAPANPLRPAQEIGALNSVSTETVRQQVMDEVRTILFGDTVGRTDFAQSSLGAKVIDYTGKWSLNRMVSSWSPFASYSGSPDVVLEPDNSVGHCWAVQGDSAFITIQLAHRVLPESVSVDHISSMVSVNIQSAPKEFRVWGYTEKGGTPHFLGSVGYDINGPQVQTFPIQSGYGAISAVKFELVSNHGADYTCIYRLRVHGSPVTLQV